MKIFNAFVVSLLLLLDLPGGLNVSPRGQVVPTTEPVSGSVVCEPGVYAVAPDTCLPLGPSQYITRAAQEGIPFPALPLPAYPPDSALADIPFQYFKLAQEEAVFYVFSSLEEAESSSVSGQAVGPGDVFVSYVNRVENENGIFYQLRSGAWVRSDFGARFALHRKFQGLLFSSSPRYPFGWVLGQVQSVQAPSYNAQNTGRTYNRYEIVQVYAVQESEGNTWLMIAANEWMDYHQVARVIPRTSRPDDMPAGRWIEINLDEQTLAVYEDDQLKFATVISSGTGAWATRPGLFQIYEKFDVETMSGFTEADRSDYYYLEDVPWTMYFDEKRALHGAYWHDSFGYQRSHGCVNLSLGDAHWIFDWAQNGEYVYVYGQPSP